MIVEFDKSFSKSLDDVSDIYVKRSLEKIIISIERAHSIHEILNIKKLAGFKSYYRVRISDYRVGLELIGGSKVRFIIISHRKNIYNIFP